MSHDAELPPLPPGYDQAQLLGQGGMSAVYLARQISLDRWVALKVMRGELPPGVEQEARLIARINHPHIIGVYDTGPIDDGYFIAMEYAPNGDLQRIVQDGPLPTDKAVGYCRQLLQALGAAHRNELLHLDVKPANLLLDSHHNVKLADFGLAALNASAEGGGYGTPGYSGPELYRGEAPDHRTDLYAAGMVLYDLLSGTLPNFYTGERAALPAGFHLPPKLWAVIEKATASERNQRYQSAEEFLKALDQAAAPPAKKTSGPAVKSGPPRPVAHHRMARVIRARTTNPTGKILAGIGVLLLAVIGWFAVAGVPEPIKPILPKPVLDLFEHGAVMVEPEQAPNGESDRPPPRQPGSTTPSRRDRPNAPNPAHRPPALDPDSSPGSGR